MAAIDRPTPQPRLSKASADRPQAPPRRAVVSLFNESSPSLPTLSSTDTASASSESTPTPSVFDRPYSSVLAVENPEYMSLEQFRQICKSSFAAEPTLSSSISSQLRRPPPRPRAASKVMDALDDCVSVKSMDRDIQLELMDDTRSTYDSWIDKHPAPDNPEAVGESVCFSGWTKVVLNKKDHKKLWCTLKNLTLVFYPSDEENTTILLGPIRLQHLVYMGNDVDSSSPAFSLVFDTTIDHHSSPLNLQLTVADVGVRDCWLMLLAKCIVPNHDTLVYSMDAVDQAGPVYLRQGATSLWCRGWAYAREKRFFYVAESSENVFEIDIRKLVAIKTNVNRQDWCHKVAHSINGPLLLALDGGSLYLQGFCDSATRRWRDVLQWQLTLPSNRLDHQRLTADNVPVMVDKCIKFIATHGLFQEGLYRKNGSSSEVRQLMEEFKQDPTNVHIVRNNDESVNTVAEVLRRFFRRLDDSLLTRQLVPRLLQICNMPEAEFHRKIIMYQETLNELPAVNYNTLRKLLDHLKDVTEKCTRNKATISNIAKIFGPTLLSCDKDDEENNLSNFNTTAQHSQVVHDLISNFVAIFRVTEDEIKTKSLIDRAGWVNDAVQETGNAPKARADGLLVSIHLFERDNQAFNVQSEMTAHEVCQFAISHRQLPVDEGPYALFEVIRSGQLERRVGDDEKVRSMVVGRWLEWKNDASDCYLVVKRDLLRHRLATVDSYPFASDVRVAEVGGKSFKKASLQLQRGHVCYYKDSKCQKMIGEWPVEKMLWFNGHEHKRDPPSPYTLTFFVDGDKKMAPDKSKFLGMCLVFRQEIDLFRWLAAVLSIHKPLDAFSRPLVDC
uniref:Uncharacterized protein n=1 Tax=Plectus sambesii TaxID=2011161 RepID=A0A914WNH1_9BILA